MAAPADSGNLSQDFKLCGFLPLVVSVITSSPVLKSEASVLKNTFATPCSPLQCKSQSGSTGWGSNGRLSEANSCCAELRGSSSNSGFVEPPVSRNVATRQSGSSQGGVAEQSGEETPTRSADFSGRSILPSKKDDFSYEGAFYSRRRPDVSNRITSSGCLSNSQGFTSENAERLIGAECWLTGEGAEVQFHTSRGFVLSPIVCGRRQDGRELDSSPQERDSVDTFTSGVSLDSFHVTEDSSVSTGLCEQEKVLVGKGDAHGGGLNKNGGDRSINSFSQRNDTGRFGEVESTPTAVLTPGLDAASERKKCIRGRKQRRVGYANGSGHILNHLQVLTVRNSVRVQGHVVRVARRAADVRAVVLLDLYLPSFLWSGRNYWKPGPAATAVLNHVSCDWETRRKSLACNGRKLDCGDSDDIWDLGECQVLGCEMHPGASEVAKNDIHALFKSLPSLVKEEKGFSTTIIPDHGQERPSSGIWDIPNEILMSIFSRLLPKDLQSVAATCRHTRELALSIMPCMNLKLFPHQQAAVWWMLQRELHPETLTHPLFRDLQTEDGFHFYLNCVSGDLSPEMPPSVMDFRGGLFCDEPGLGKTVTALSLILKTQGTLSEPPAGTNVRWCEHRSGDRYGYYEISSQRVTSVLKRCMELKARRNRMDVTPPAAESLPSSTGGRKRPRQSGGSTSSTRPIRHRSLDSGPATRASNAVKRKLLEAYEGLLVDGSMAGSTACVSDNNGLRSAIMVNSALMNVQHTRVKNSNKAKVDLPHKFEDVWVQDVWVQCDSCSKWRKIQEGSKEPEEGLAWFCNMNKDTLHQSCSDPEENWDSSGAIRSLPGFYKAGGASGLEQNIIHFANVLKDCTSLRDIETNAALTWLANLSPEKLAKMAGPGVPVPPGLNFISIFGDDQHGYDIIFQRFGLVQSREGRGVKKWCYPRCLDGLVFDLPALREALIRPLDVVRLYLSRATLIVVPPNLVEHWKNQILRHTKPGQLRVYVWNEQKKSPKVQDLAWNFDIVITTFSRLSSEWSYKESSVLMSVHWLRIMLDEGHTLGASLSITNKLQMAVSMHASRRWVLTGTPTPHTPNSQVAHLQPMLKFLHEEFYGGNQKSWEGGILKPFEAGREEGRARLLQLLQRCMISARKSDLCTIPPCVRKMTLLSFAQKHAESYNELVVTVRRNILMADWNDPSHVESLLNPKQWKFRSTTIRNVRLSCCVAGHIKVRNAGEDIQETMDILAQQGMDPMSLEFAIIRTALLYGGTCNRCEEWCRLPIVTPCKHLLCLDCVALDRERCTMPGCGNPYEMQSPEDLTRPENPNPKWPVPQDLIELQPSYVQDNWDPDWQATSSSKVAYLVERLKTLQGAAADHNQSLDGEDRVEFNLDRDSKGVEPDQQHKLDNLPKTLPEKAIVFSQFLEHIHVIERQLAAAGIKVAGMYSPMHSMNKMKSLLMFQNDRDCTVLLMDGSAALGLDLSFVTHVFLMEPIWDRSMEEQVVSRAHRMGATRPVLVETLAMRGTIEEQMLEFLQDPLEHNRAIKQEAHISDNGRSSLRTVHDFAESSYLARLTFVRTKTGA